VSPEALLRIRSLELRARVVVEGIFHGIHRSPFHGFSVEFSEYRPYAPGDDLKFLDWRLFARSDRYHVKRFEDETNLRCHLLVDRSRSMGYGSIGHTKDEYARTAAVTLAYFLWGQRDAVGLVAFDEGIVDVVPARYRPGQMQRLLRSLAAEPSGRGTDLTRPLEQLARTVTRRGLVILISDLLAPIASLETQLGLLRSRGHEVVVLRVVDPAEESFAFADASVFEDLESGRELYVDPAAAREQYLRRYRAHVAEIERICATLGIDLHRFATDRPLEVALLDLVSSRLRRGRRVLRRAGARGRQEAKS
jgi:uncharacterized protein (DUF58 family)